MGCPHVPLIHHCRHVSRVDGATDKPATDRRPAALGTDAPPELVDAICDRAFFVEQERVRTHTAFNERVNKAKTRLGDVAQEVCRVVDEIVTEYQTLRPRLNQRGVPIWQRAMTDIRNQLKELLKPAFIISVPLARSAATAANDRWRSSTTACL